MKTFPRALARARAPLATLALLSFVSPFLAAASARADDKAACLDATSKGQKLRDAHKLVEAREQLRICAAAQCPAVIQSDCANWLADVDKALPGVVLTAKNAAGGYLIDVKVTIDGQPLVSKLDGRAVPVNAGPHLFHFEAADGSRVEQQVFVREGDKNQQVTVALGAAAPPPSAATPSPASGGGASSSPVRTIGWVTGAVGVVGLGVGAVFGVVAMGDKNGAHCDANNVCDPGSTSGIKSAAVISDVGWIAGGVLLATGAALVLFAPSDRPASAASGTGLTRVSLAPAVTPTGGALVLGGAW